MQCIWAGRVAIDLKLDGTTTLTLGLNHSEFSDTAEYLGMEIILKEVSYCSNDHFGEESRSSVRLKVIE
jgi:hypothetical protein